MKNLLKQGVLVSCVLGLAACGGGGGGGSNTPPAAVASSVAVVVVASSVAPVASSVAASSVAVSSVVSSSSVSSGISTTYKVSINVPPSFTVQAGGEPLAVGPTPPIAADLSSVLNSGNVAVVVVDLAGNVLEKIVLQAGDVVNTNDGFWSVRVSGIERADVLIVVDITKPIALAVGDSIYQNGFLFAPITNSEVDIDVGSTAGYGNFIQALGGVGSFVTQNIDPTSPQDIAVIDHLVDNVQKIVAKQSLSAFNNVNAALASLKTQVDAIVNQEVTNTQQASTATAVNLLRDQGGMYIYQNITDGNNTTIYYDALIGMENLTSYRYNGSAFAATQSEPSEFDLILSSNGWVAPGNGTRVIAYNDDGTVLTELVGAEGVTVKLQALQVFSLVDRNISNFLQTSVGTKPLAALVDNTQTFASDAKGYRIKSTFLNTLYAMPVDKATVSAGICSANDLNEGMSIESLGGNCNALGLINENQQYTAGITSFNDIYSPNVAVGAAGFKAVTLGDPIVVQLINDTAKTARFYLQTVASPEAPNTQTLLIGNGTWATATLPNVVGDASAIRVSLTNSLNSVNYLPADIQYLIVKQAGYLRLAFGITPKTTVQDTFNAPAHNSIINSLLPPQ